MKKTVPSVLRHETNEQPSIRKRFKWGDSTTNCHKFPEAPVDNWDSFVKFCCVGDRISLSLCVGRSVAWGGVCNIAISGLFEYPPEIQYWGTQSSKNTSSWIQNDILGGLSRDTYEVTNNLVVLRYVHLEGVTSLVAIRWLSKIPRWSKCSSWDFFGALPKRQKKLWGGRVNSQRSVPQLHTTHR